MPAPPRPAPVIEIRDALPSDTQELSKLLAQLGYPVDAAELPARIERFVSRGNGRVLVAVEGETIVGFAALELTFPIHHAHPVAHLSAFAISESSRRRGVGRILLSALESAARREGCQRVVVTSAERRADAHLFYPAAGYSYTGRRFGKELD